MNTPNIESVSKQPIGPGGVLPAGVDPIIRMKGVTAFTGLGPSSIYDLVARGLFPKPISLGGRAKGWLLSSLEQWKQERIAASLEQGGDQ